MAGSGRLKRRGHRNRGCRAAGAARHGFRGASKWSKALAVRIPPDIPAYAFIKRQLKLQIESGELGEGERVPSELELAQYYKVSRNPTRQALRDLELEGYITRTPGRGSFVAPVSQRQKLFKFGNGWRTLAIACPEVECHYSRSVIQGFLEATAECGFHTMVYFLRFSDETEFDFISDMRNSGIEGMALWLQHPSKRTLELLGRFRRSAFPFVLIDRYIRTLEADFVVTDNNDMGYRLTRALIDRGHRRIGAVLPDMDNSAVEDRFEGYRRALKEAGLPFMKEAVGVFPDEGQPVRHVVNRMLAIKGRPTAFFCANDGVAQKLIDELTELGYAFPGDAEVALVDDSQLSAALEAPVIAAAQSGHEMGRRSAELLMARIAEPQRPVQRVFLKASITGAGVKPSGGDVVEGEEEAQTAAEAGEKEVKARLRA
jgi:GntR family transcriptional regulator of arabinose operon